MIWKKRRNHHIFKSSVTFNVLLDKKNVDQMLFISTSSSSWLKNLRSRNLSRAIQMFKSRLWGHLLLNPKLNTERSERSLKGVLVWRAAGPGRTILPDLRGHFEDRMTFLHKFVCILMHLVCRISRVLRCQSNHRRYAATTSKWDEILIATKLQIRQGVPTGRKG